MFPSKEFEKPFYPLLFSYLNLCIGGTRDISHQLTTFHLSKSAPLVYSERPKSPSLSSFLPSCYPLTVALFVIAQQGGQNKYSIPSSKHAGKDFKMLLSVPP